MLNYRGDNIGTCSSVTVKILFTELLFPVFVVDLPLYSSAISAHLLFAGTMNCFHLIKQAYMFISVRHLEKGKRINMFLNVPSSYWLLTVVFLCHCYLFLLHLFVLRSVSIVSLTLCTVKS